MKTLNVLYWSVGLLVAQIILWFAVLTLYLSQHSDFIIQYGIGTA